MISLIEFEGGGVPEEIPTEWLEGNWGPVFTADGEENIIKILQDLYLSDE